MSRDDFVYMHTHRLLERAERLRGMGIIDDTPTGQQRFIPRGETDGEKRIERYVHGYYSKHAKWPRVGQVMSTTRQSSDELLAVVTKSPHLEMRAVELTPDASEWKRQNGGLLASNVIVLVYEEVRDDRETTNLPDQ